MPANLSWSALVLSAPAIEGQSVAARVVLRIAAASIATAHCRLPTFFSTASRGAWSGGRSCSVCWHRAANRCGNRRLQADGGHVVL
ncbi:exported hypothetical protein [Xanthomonas citri pv. fuscans]|nr:exported hypothetical protein [Xanthomonas citri pv. fuscans]SON99813.1 exported hypothetical protein [Xanthomonas citri pv. fuscans]SOO03137.1 exported hypothetical protein [Xanthomonas citri pv. fuscans]SOO09303.1 exported hypothetical protein [Xanthomonas citri pv. fuscans]SOO15601.1 exported hypothetical protein [Xanthomonas citri pv. fuscans]